MTLHRQRCVRHPDREAAARCPACGRFFCRECVTEHEGRLLCAACLRPPDAPADAQRRASVLKRLQAAARAVALAASLLLLWGFYTLFGILLNAVPHRFHDSTAFETLWADGAE